MDTNVQQLLKNTGLCRKLMLQMLLINKFEEAALELFDRGLVHGTMHLCIGEEAVGAGTGAALKTDDYLLATHRCHGQSIGKGVDLKAMMAELLGRATGTNHGKGGSMHICDFDKGLLGANGIVGGNGPIACGAALTIKMKHIPDRVAVCFFGDGASNEGSMHESMNLAAAWKLPVLFVLTNNTYGMSTPLSRVVGDTDLTKRAIPYGMKAYECDGNDILAVYSTVEQARQYALENGPVLIIEHTYRTSGHSKSDKNQYRSAEEIHRWQERNPIQRFRNQLTQAGTFPKTVLDALEQEAEKIIADTLEYALAQPQPTELEADVYAGEECGNDA